MSRGLNEAGRVATVLSVLGLVVWASHRSGAPSELPEVALGWTLLLHVERAAALLAAIGIVTLVGWRALQGDFPSRLGQIEFRIEKTAADALAVTEGLERRVRELELVTRKAGERQSEAAGGQD